MGKTETLIVAADWRLPDWDHLPSRPLKTQSGRGQIELISHPRGVIVARAYRHGGLLRHLLASFFLKSSRPAREFRAHRLAFEAGIATSEPIGWRSEHTGLPFIRRYFYYSKFLENARTLPQQLRKNRLPPGTYRQIAGILAKLQAQAIVHADLNLNNWLWLDGEILLIDFDKAGFETRTSHAFLVASLGRMARSALKLGFGKQKRAFFRLLLVCSHRFQLDPRAVLAAIPQRHLTIRRFQPLIWKLFGGHVGQSPG